MSKKFLILLLLVIQNQLSAQRATDSLSVKININFDHKPITVGEKFVSSNSDTLSFETIKFYLSSFEIKHKDKSVFIEKKSYHLVDITNPKTTNIKLAPNYDAAIESVKFNIGVDSLASVSGALDGDLDPVNAMYWAWQSGFINIKIEGESSSCKTRNNKFQLHIGGYLEPNYSMRTVEFTVEKDQTNELIINVDLEKLFSKMNLNVTNSIMIPGEKAMKTADLFEKTFSIE